MKKGFTLVELLAVIVILALLGTIAIPNMFKVSNEVQKDMYCEKVNMIISAAKTWGSSHTSELKTNCYKEMTIKDLVNKGIIKKESDEAGKPMVENPVTGGSMENSKVGIYLKNKRAYVFYIETDTDSAIPRNCEEDELRVCNDGENERQNNKIVCVKRPKNKC